MKAKTFQQASHRWFCYIEDTGSVMNEHSHPSIELSEEKKNSFTKKENSNKKKSFKKSNFKL